jgi:hypothetical protein
MKSSLRFSFLIAMMSMAISGAAVAQDSYPDTPSDPPGRVLRLQSMDGPVSLQPGGVDDWVAANLNRPLTTADRIWVDQDARAELTMGTAALRMGSQTSVAVTNLDDQTAQIELDQGTLELSVRVLNPGEIVEVDTPNFAYTVERPGEYRFEVLPDQDTSWITVRRGEGEATGEGNAVRVRGGQQFSFSQGQSLSYVSTPMRQNDDFDEWCRERERREISSPSASYVAPGTIGYEDLDGNGNWQTTPTYGAVWFPNVNAGWAPYRDGHWAWVEPWGWTWVDDAPWGFAPFHYGRWAMVDDRWGWIPGPVGVRPVYAPALVAWVGGPGFGVSVGLGGGVGWFPLGWHDPYLPSYRVSAEYARNVNISGSRMVNVTVVNNYYTTNNVSIRNTTINNIHYENAAARGAVTGVSSATFASGKAVRGNSVVIPASAVGRTSVMGAAAVVPTKEAVLGGHAPAVAPKNFAAPRQVVSKTAPPPRPVSFDQQRPLLEKSNGVPLSPATRANLRASTPAPVEKGGQPVGSQMGGRPGANPPAATRTGGAPAAVQPRSNETFGRPVPAPAPAGNQAPAKVNQPPAQWQHTPPTQVERTAPAGQPSAAPAAQPQPAVRPAPQPAPQSRPQTAPVVTAQPKAAPAPAPQQHAAPAPAPKKTPPPAKENKEKEKDPKGH